MVPPTAGTSGERPQVSAKVRKYTCMYTPDVHKKAKKWHDGFVRLHHFNGKAYLFTLPSPHFPSGHTRAEVFVRLPTAAPFQAVSGGIPEDMVWSEGEEVEFDDLSEETKQRYIATIGELVGEETKDLTAALDPVARRATATKRKAESRDALDSYINAGEQREQKRRSQADRPTPSSSRDRPLIHRPAASPAPSSRPAPDPAAAPRLQTNGQRKKRLGTTRPGLISTSRSIEVDWARFASP